jgi:multiple sugar transport system substrate-binding protein
MMALDNANPLARIAEKPVDRRFLLRTMGGGALAAAAIPVLAACTGSGSGGDSGSKTVTFGSGSSDDVPKRAYAAFTAAFTKKTGDKDGWPAMGTFDYINMRTNGYQFHMDLCAHKESWDQKKVNDVFDNWKQLLQFQDPNALGMTWQEAAQTLGDSKSGMYLLGSFVTQQFTDKAVLDDIDFFPFPEIAVEGQDAVEAPIDGLLLSKKGGQNQAAKDMLAFMGTAAGQEAYFSVDKSNLMTAKGADTSSYSALNKKCAEVIGAAKSISQFFDRDALPAMANNVMIPALQSFLKDGTVDTKNLEAQAKTLYAAQ